VFIDGTSVTINVTTTAGALGWVEEWGVMLALPSACRTLLSALTNPHPHHLPTCCLQMASRPRHLSRWALLGALLVLPRLAPRACPSPLSLAPPTQPPLPPPLLLLRPTPRWSTTLVSRPAAASGCTTPAASPRRPTHLHPACCSPEAPRSLSAPEVGGSVGGWVGECCRGEVGPVGGWLAAGQLIPCL